MIQLHGSPVNSNSVTASDPTAPLILSEEIDSGTTTAYTGGEWYKLLQSVLLQVILLISMGLMTFIWNIHVSILKMLKLCLETMKTRIMSWVKRTCVVCKPYILHINSSPHIFVMVIFPEKAEDKNFFLGYDALYNWLYCWCLDLIKNK